MNRITIGLSALLLIASSGVPAAAQQADRASETVTYILCTGDYVCANDPSVVTTWPLERWGSVRRRGTQASSATPSPSSDQRQLAGTLGGSPNPTSP